MTPAKKGMFHPTKATKASGFAAGSADQPLSICTFMKPKKDWNYRTHKKNRGPLVSMKYLLFNRDPYQGLLYINIYNPSITG